MQSPGALRFDSRFLRELPGDPTSGNSRRQVEGAAWSRVSPTPVRAPRLLAASREVASDLGIPSEDLAHDPWLAALAGNALLPGFEPYAACYGGHQFGSWAGQLGDGRAITLAELVRPDGRKFELQLKGAGPTPYSRTADGRAVLRSSLREFLCSEAMHHLGVPTTRALSLVGTGESVVRDMFYDGRPEAEPGAIVCRVAPSFLRFGNYELPSARGDIELLRKLVDFTIAREFPELEAPEEEDSAQDREKKYLRFFDEVVSRTAKMIAEWMRVGFVHGVMNTDNMSILGLTIDYGPYGFLDEYDPAFTPNTTDAAGRRYAYARQPEMAYWNLSRLAIALRPLFREATELQAALDRFATTYHTASLGMYARKFGFAASESDEALLVEAFSLLHEAELDFTLFFRRLADHVESPGREEPTRRFFECFYRSANYEPFAPRLGRWLERYDERCAGEARGAADRASEMRRSNPAVVFRNYLAQEAIDALREGNSSPLEELFEVLQRPYDEPENARFAAKRPEWARHRAGCSMLSCSS